MRAVRDPGTGGWLVFYVCTDRGGGSQRGRRVRIPDEHHVNLWEGKEDTRVRAGCLLLTLNRGRQISGADATPSAVGEAADFVQSHARAQLGVSPVSGREVA